jgi:phospholipid/cholesterol/gamma-HCH transport system substrate-binding protein
MRRLVKIALVLVIAGIAALVLGTVAQGSDTYRFDVIFDDARGLIAGQQVKIAGAEAGSITNVVVDPAADGADKARVEAEITGPFQFHTNASCIIRPNGLIAENYLDCDPGSTTKPLLKAAGDYPPTVPVSHTSEPVSLLDLFNIFNLPTRERFQALVDELGITTAGNGDEINSILLRADPTLQAAQRVIAILDRQTSQISTAIEATDQIATVGANHVDAVRAFINQAKGLTQLTADHSSALEQGINKLPAFLSASTPAMADLDTVARDGTPLLASLHAAVPSLTKVNHEIVPFAKVAEPALTSVSKAITAAIPDTKAVTPVVKTLSNYLTASAGTTAAFSKLLVNLIQHGFSENFLSVLYYTATALGKKDDDSHMLSSLLIFPGSGLCGTYATTESAACNAHYGTAASYTPERTKATAAATTAPKTTATSTPSAPAASPATPSPATSTNPISSLGSGLQNLGSTVSGGVTNLVNGVGSTVNKVTSGLSGTTTSASSSQTSTSSLQNLLGYLLK